MLEQREGGCHCGRVRFRAKVDLDLLSQCNCSICTKKGILHLPIAIEDFELLQGKNALTVYTFGTGVAQHSFCSHCGMHAFYIPRSQPDRITVNARCLDGIDGPNLKPTRFFDGRHWEEAQRRRIAEGGHVPPAGLTGATTLQSILDRALAAARSQFPTRKETTMAQTIAVERVDHIGIRVRDLDRALAFYGVLGFELVRRAEGDDVAIVRNGQGVELNLVFNANAGDPAANVLMDVREKFPGYTHIALRVASIPATIAALKANDVAITQGPVSFGGAGHVSVFIRDPDRNVIELRGRDQREVEGVIRYVP